MGRGELSLLPSGSLTWEASRLPLFIRSLGCSDVDGSPVAPLSPLCQSFPLAERVQRATVSPPRAAPPPSLGAALTGIADLMGRERSSPYLSPLPPGPSTFHSQVCGSVDPSALAFHCLGFRCWSVTVPFVVSYWGKSLWESSLHNDSADVTPKDSF